MKTVFLFLSSLIFSAATQAQYSNSVKLSTNAFYIKDRVHTGSNLFNQLGISYERKLYRNIYAQVNYSQWKHWGSEALGKKNGYEVRELGYQQLVKGSLRSRLDYRMVDLSVGYNYSLTGKDQLSAKIGASYCWGTNQYLRDFWVNPDQDIVIFQSTKEEYYWGTVPQLSYDRLFLKGRINVGVDIKGRYYAHRTPQYDLGIHIGVNF
jgi:hypothetical protein